MVTATPAAFPSPARVIRPRGLIAPLSAWVAAIALFDILVAALAAAFIYATPLPTDRDTRFYRSQIADLDDQVRSLRESGEDPLSIVFVGTSRIKNATFDPAQVAASARSAGIQRPVASTYMAIYWGGFERLAPAIDLIEQRKPDAVVIMPDLLVEDLSYNARARIGYWYLHAKLWSPEFNLFGDEEFDEPNCHGFGRPAERHAADHRTVMTQGGDLRGPQIGRRAVKSLAGQGIAVIFTNVPVSRALMARRPSFSAPEAIRETRLDTLPNVHTAWTKGPLADATYCDWVHIDPARAAVWQRAFFSSAAGALNRLDR